MADPESQTTHTIAASNITSDKENEKRRFLDHNLVAVAVGALIIILPTWCQLHQQQQLHVKDKKWDVVTSYHSTLTVISSCPRHLRNVFYKVADKAAVHGSEKVTQQDLDDAFSVLEQCNGSVISAHISLAGIGQSTNPLDCLSSTLSTTRNQLNEIPALLQKKEQENVDITSLVGSSLKTFSENWTKCIKDLNVDTLQSAKAILAQ